MLGNVNSPERVQFLRENGIDDDRMLSEVLRRELSCTDAGHLRNVVRQLVNSHMAANQRIRELEQNLTSLTRQPSTGRL